jgi:hypothetical protein
MTGAEYKPGASEARPVSDPPPVSAAALAPGLHFVATPIGTARDITLRALDTLRAADVIASEDTRTTRRLLEIHGIPAGRRPLLAYHDHNGAQMRPKILKLLQDGEACGLCLGCRNAASSPIRGTSWRGRRSRRAYPSPPHPGRRRHWWP